MLLSFSNSLKKWGLEKVTGEELLLYICEAPLTKLHYVMADDRTYQYGIDIEDPLKIPIGPYFINQPIDVVFDLSKRKITNDVSLSCLAGGYPAPTYEWFKEDYQGDKLVSIKIDPLKDSRFTISGGTLIIHEPRKEEDRGLYHCKASNDYGTIISETVKLTFGFIGEFNLKRSEEKGEENWGKTVYCDPPQSFPGVKYYWARDYFPNFVEEDKRVFVSFDGALYFSALENIDRGNYSCNVQSRVSDTGRNGPFFPLNVHPHFVSCSVLHEHLSEKRNNSLPLIFVKICQYEVYFRARLDDSSVSARCRVCSPWTKSPKPSTAQISKQFSKSISGGSSCWERSQIGMCGIWIQSVRCVDYAASFYSPVPSYNWTRRGSALPRQAIFASYNRVLLIPNVQVEDQGEYICRATNDRASIHNSVVLSIQAEPNFTIPLTDKHMDNKGELTWTCEAFGIPDVSYAWMRNGELLEVDKLPEEDRARYVIQDNVLTIRYLNPERDPAMYQCRARNDLRTKYSSAQLRVLSLKPSFKKRPLETETYAAEGGNVTIICSPEAAPRPKFTWKKDSLVIGSGGRRQIKENGNLIISPVSRDDEGMYLCIAQNQYGTDESYGRLIVLRGPMLVEQLNPRVVTSVQRDVYLRCQAASEDILDIAYIWTHNGLRIPHSEYANTNIKIDGGSLVIYNITLAEGGDYECIVKSAVGRIASRTSVFVEGPPGPPGGVSVVDVSRYSATVQWTDGATNGRPIVSYIISGRTSWNKTWVNISDNVVAKEVNRYTGRKEALLDNILRPWSTYEFRVAAANVLGYGFPSAPSPMYNTPPDKPHRAPSNVGGGGGKIGDLTIAWTPLPPEDQAGPGVYYKVFWRRSEHDSEFQSLELKDLGNIGVTVVRIQQDFYYTKYDVKVQIN
ncbi:Contactin-3 [Homalodisca vitripennis]|nr:Contactin-3 [Homalodisca vitripennis]